MPVSATTLGLLLEADMGNDWLMLVVASLESTDTKPRSANAERQAKWRETHKPRSADVISNVTNNATSNVTAVTPELSEEPSHIENYTNTSNSTDKSTLIQTALSKHERRISRGTRLPDDFVPLPNILELGHQLGLTDDEYWAALPHFKDHYRAAPGSRGIKLDWQATWRNWVRETANRKKAKQHGRTSTYSKPLSISERFAGFAARLDAEDIGESGDGGGGETVAGLPGLRKSA
jgi:hypothetical protein